jgi:hypothetical protein
VRVIPGNQHSYRYLVPQSFSQIFPVDNKRKQGSVPLVANPAISQKVNIPAVNRQTWPLGQSLTDVGHIKYGREQLINLWMSLFPAKRKINDLNCFSPKGEF